MLYKKGDKLKIIGNSNEHHFDIGEEVTITDVNNYSYNAKNTKSAGWCVVEKDLEPIDDFILPSCWHIIVTNENVKEVTDWYNKDTGSDGFKTGNVVGMVHWKRTNEYEKGWDYHLMSTPDSSYDNGPEITTEQFRQHVLKQDKQSKMSKQLVGYKAPNDLFGGKVKKGTIYVGIDAATFGPKGAGRTEYKNQLPSEIVTTWEAVYDKPAITFTLGTPARRFLIDERGIECQGRLFSFEEVDGLLQVMLKGFPFGSTSYAFSKVQVGCQAGGIELNITELRTIVNKYNEYEKS